MILEDNIRKASKFLRDQNIKSHELDAQIILSEIMGVTKEFLLLNNDVKLSKETEKKYYEAIKRRSNSEPVAYITKKKEFWSQNFKVDKSTLIPRPETELLIYKIVSLFKKKSANILDIGTGSGCILLSVLSELTKSRGIGIDISKNAIQIAKENSERLNLSNRSKFKIFNIEDFNAGKYDVIISNPPYIPLRDIKNLDKDVKHYEPLVALKGGIDGLDLIKKVIYKSTILLKKNGILVIEIGNHQYIKVLALLKKHGFRAMAKEYDNNYNVRCIISTWRNYF